MAAVPSRVVAYLPSLRTLIHRLRATASTPSSLTTTLLTSPPPTASHLLSITSLPEIKHDTDHQPGLSKYTSALKRPDTIAKLGLQPGLMLPGAVGLPSSSEKKVDEEVKEQSVELTQEPTSPVECVVQECPSFLHAGLMQLFPGVTLSCGNLTVITISEKTNNDMTLWSHDVEEEREELMEHFVNSAKEICSRVIGAGHWADFIDPSSGRPYFGAYTNETLFETDDRYRYFGFDILDFGCCKCISHPIWGTSTFVGIIFTDAPIMSHVIQHILTL